MVTITITVSAEDLSRAYFPNRRITGAVMLPKDLGLTSLGRHVAFITIRKGSHRVTLSGYYSTKVGGKPITQKWAETYSADAVPIDD